MNLLSLFAVEVDVSLLLLTQGGIASYSGATLLV